MISLQVIGHANMCEELEADSVALLVLMLTGESVEGRLSGDPKLSSNGISTPDHPEDMASFCTC